MEPHGHGFYTGFQMGDCAALLVKLLMLIGVSVHIRYGGYHKWSYRQEHPPLCGADCKMMFQTRNSIFDPNFEIFKNELLN